MKNLVNKVITVYTDGGWKAHGKVELDQEDRLGLVTADNSVFIILKAKISMIQIEPEVIKSEAAQEPEDSQRYQPPTARIAGGVKVTQGAYATTEENYIGAGNQYGSLIPSDMLEGEEEGDSIDEFAVSWGAPSNGRVEVTVDSKKET